MEDTNRYFKGDNEEIAVITMKNGRIFTPVSDYHDLMRLYKELADYAEHGSRCQLIYRGGKNNQLAEHEKKCTCGLNKLLKEIK